MALSYGFFNSVNGDRTYNADTISNMFKGLISDGVYESVGDAFRVSAISGSMSVSIGTGRAIVGDRWAENDAALTLDINSSHVTLNRYTAVALRADKTARTVSLATIDSVPATSPVKPAPTRSETVYDIILAYVYVGAGVSSVTAANIEDARANTSVCGFVTGLIEQVDTTSLFIQYQAAYEEQLAQMDTWQDDKEAAYEEWFSALTEDLNVDTYVDKYSAIHVPSTADDVFHIPASWNYDESVDILELYIDGMRLPRNGNRISTWGIISDYISISGKYVVGSVYTITCTKSRIGVAS
jgi:hypothetical protein